MDLNEDDIILIDNKDIFLKYSNIVKNSYKVDRWGNFIIKQYIDAFGNFEGQYVFVKPDIFKHKNILPYTKKFNPEKLI